MNNADYWARRMRILGDAIRDQSYDYALNLEKQFDEAIREHYTEADVVSESEYKK